MFSSTAEYALRAVVHLATRESACAAPDIAAATRVPAGYLNKVLSDLRRAGLVVARRGPTGGHSLARDASDISVLDVVNAVDPIRRITTCPLGLPEHRSGLCRLHRRLDDAIAMVETALADSPIAELVPTRARAGVSCAFPVELTATSSTRRPR